ncbi:hypothetical protein ACFWMQ_18630 [Streptomyces sp. NPDC058372]|uniref:hypothetical protein n=1 Tax=Streptomyces sp. NPDC058372 TaxID=3346464 RepID=UPI00365CF217
MPYPPRAPATTQRPPSRRSGSPSLSRSPATTSRATSTPSGAAARSCDQRWRSLVRAAVEAAGDDPVAAVTAPFDALRSWLGASARGCAFINALAELPDPSHPAHRIAADQKRWLLHLFEELAAAADRAHPATLATQLLVLHEGAVALRPLSLGTLAVSADLARALVEADIR